MRLLMLEDNPSDAALLQAVLRQEMSLEVLLVDSREAFLRALQNFAPQVILADYQLPAFDGMEALALARRYAPAVPFIVVTGAHHEETAVRCLQAGASDYILKDRLKRIGAAVRAALDRRETAQHLREQEQLTAVIAKHVSDLVALLDSDGRFRYVSPSWRALATAPSLLVGTPHCERVHPQDRQRIEAELAQALQTGSERRLEYRLLCDEGEPRAMEASWSAVRDAEGSVSQIIIVSRDVTERKQAEEAQRRSHEALEQANREFERASRAKNRFLATMTHELRTPMNAILGYTSLLLDGQSDALSPSQRTYLDYVREAGEHLLELIQDLLDISSVQAGNLHLEPVDVNLREVVESEVARLAPAAEKKQQAIRLVAPPLEPVRVDARRIRQIVYNLLSNAVKFTPAGGDIDVEVSRDDGGVHISVSDSGIGIPFDDQERVFGAFEQGSKEIYAASEGAGLGLAIARELVQAHGGRLELLSKPGAGSRFTVTLSPKGPRSTRHRADWKSSDRIPEQP